MKNIVILIVFCLLIISCKKSTITPGNYATTQPVKDTSNWQNQYTNGGVVPTWTTNTGTNDLVGTKWVLTKIQNSLSITIPNDTIRFISNIYYTINNGAVRNYQLTNSVASTNKTLSLYYFYPFGGSHYSGEVSGMFVIDGVINMCEFKNIQNTTTTLKAWFKKI